MGERVGGMWTVDLKQLFLPLSLSLPLPLTPPPVPAKQKLLCATCVLLALPLSPIRCPLIPAPCPLQLEICTDQGCLLTNKQTNK